MLLYDARYTYVEEKGFKPVLLHNSYRYTYIVLIILLLISSVHVAATVYM